MFHRFPAYFDPFTSIWEILIKMKIDMKNVDFTRFSYKYLICGFNPKIFTWKLLFQKVQMILYILHIYHFFSSCTLNELCSFEDTCKIIRFCHKCFKEFHLQVNEIYSRCQLLVFFFGYQFGLWIFEPIKREKLSWFLAVCLIMRFLNRKIRSNF